MVTGFPRWDFSIIDHRGHWVPRTEATGHWLSAYATMGAYHRERETEGMPEDLIEEIEAAYPLLRLGRSTGFLDKTDCRQATDDAFTIAAAACRCEGIPVVQDYPGSMRGAIRSYGCLLASLYRPGFFVPPDTTRESEDGWAAQLCHVLRHLRNWRVQVIDESYRSLEIYVPTSATASNEEANREEAEKIISKFNKRAHAFPNLLQSFLTLADHLECQIPAVYPVHHPSVELWDALDVTSTNFLQSLHAQSGLFEAMSGHQFEKVVGELFKRNGFEVIMTKQSHDGGYDLRVIAPITSKLKVAFLVECKNPKSGNPVGVSVIRGLRGITDTRRARTAGGIVVTTTTFSPEARKEAEASGWSLTLFERNDLLELLDIASRVAE